MAYEHKLIPFHGDMISFLVNKQDALIGAKSLVKGMGLSWGTQSYKIRNKWSKGFRWNTIKTTKGKRKALFITRRLLSDYLDSIEIRKVKEECKSKVQKYKESFLRFSYKSLLVERQIEIEKEYSETFEGLVRLIYDSVIVLGNPNAINQIAGVMRGVLSADPSDRKIPHVEKEHCPETRMRFRRMLDNVGLEIADISDPIQDLVSTTAAKHKEVDRIKHSSTGSQIETIAQKLREYEEHISDKKVKDKLRKDSLSLLRLSKGLF